MVENIKNNFREESCKDGRLMRLVQYHFQLQTLVLVRLNPQVMLPKG